MDGLNSFFDREALEHGHIQCDNLWRTINPCRAMYIHLIIFSYELSHNSQCSTSFEYEILSIHIFNGVSNICDSVLFAEEFEIFRG